MVAKKELPVKDVAGVPSEPGGHEEVDEGVDCCRGLGKKSGNKSILGRDFLEKSFTGGKELFP